MANRRSGWIMDLGLEETNPYEFDMGVYEILKSKGFLAVTGHGITKEMLAAAREASFRVFAGHPSEFLEAKYGRPDLIRQRGYTPMWTERAMGYATADAKAFWMTRIEEDPEDPNDNAFGPNIWPDEVPEFRTATLSLMDESVKIGRAVLRGLARARDLPAHALEEMTVASETVQRPIYYPPSETSFPPGAMRSGPHEDINLLTVLPGVEPGLELFLNGEWHETYCDDGIVVVNIGETLSQIVGFEDFVPTKHRVRVPEGDDGRKPRLAFPTFMHPRRSVEIRPGVLEADWLDARIKAITTG